MPVGSSARIDLRAGDHGSGDADELLLTAGQLTRIEIFLADDLKAIEHVGDQRLAILPGDVAVRERHLEVLVDRQVVQQVVALEDEADVALVQLGPLLGRQPMHGLTEKVVLAGPRRVVHAEDVEQRRLAGARRSHDRDELARLNGQRDASQHEDLTAALRIRLVEVPQRR